jgi:phospholipid/cholesterol/gamma-HCH transport system substrate-binding protein
VTEQIAQNDPQVRALLQSGPGFASEVSGLLNQIKPTLPVLLANLTTLGQTLITYNPSVEQLLVMLPAVVAAEQAFGLPKNNPTGLPAAGDFAFTISDPPSCTVGFLPPSQWRNPADTTTIDTPDGLYCKLPQDSPIAVRGARNYPCMGHPGKRAPTVELCNDPKGFQPLAMRQHALGPNPIDPNLIAQGVPPDDRVDFSDRIYAPIEGTPLPPGVVPGGTPTDDPLAAMAPPPPAAPALPSPPPGNSLNGQPIPPAEAPVAPAAGDVPPMPHAPYPGQEEIPLTEGGAVPAAPSAFSGKDSGAGPSVAITTYDPRTGRYVTPDGQVQQLTNMASGAEPKSWKDLLPI